MLPHTLIFTAGWRSPAQVQPPDAGGLWKQLTIAACCGGLSRLCCGAALGPAARLGWVLPVPFKLCQQMLHPSLFSLQMCLQAVGNAPAKAPWKKPSHSPPGECSPSSAWSGTEPPGNVVSAQSGPGTKLRSKSGLHQPENSYHHHEGIQEEFHGVF